MNKLIIEFKQKVKVGNRVFFWVTLHTDKEKREICYTRHHRVWCWDDGENEPEMNNKLRAAFRGKTGAAALNKVYKYEEAVIITA